jgi:hypothetical protein
MKKKEVDDLLNRSAGVLIRCFFLSWAFLLVWFFFYVLLGNTAFSMHAQWFELTRHDYALINYYGIAFVKVSAIIFFLFPYFAIKLVLRKRR